MIFTDPIKYQIVKKRKKEESVHSHCDSYQFLWTGEDEKDKLIYLVKFINLKFECYMLIHIYPSHQVVPTREEKKERDECPALSRIPSNFIRMKKDKFDFF